MYQRFLAAIMFSLLAPGLASAQLPDARDAPVQKTGNAHQSGTLPAKTFRLTGVLISDSSRMALISGRPVREGDRINGAEILTIEQQRVSVLVGARELSINVGHTFVVEPSTAAVARVADRAPRERRNQEQPAARSAALSAGVSTAESAASSYRHAVQSGETLSGIALRYLSDGVSMDQMMIALYRKNPQAFSNNINVLHTGAELRIPDQSELKLQTPAMAAAAVAHHAEVWRTAGRQAVAGVVDTSRSREYGPVQRGETLSAIASKLAHDGVSMNQMMIALYHSNPLAFSNNLNVLYEGALLCIPDEHELRRRAPAAAAAEVVRQTQAWQAAVQRHAPTTPDPAQIMASAESFAN